MKLDNLGHVVALVGRNGAGKTTILKAIEWAAALALSGDNTRLVIGESPGESLTEIELELAIGDYVYQYRVGDLFFMGEKPSIEMDHESLSLRNGDGSWEMLFDHMDDEIAIGNSPTVIGLGSAVGAIPALASLLGRSDSLQPHLRAVSNALLRLRYYPGHSSSSPNDIAIDEPIGPISAEIYDNWVMAHASGQERGPILFRLIHAHNTQPKIFAEIKQLMGPGGLDLLDDVNVFEIGDITPTRSQRSRQHRYFDVRFSPARAKTEVFLHQLSGGTRHALYLLLGLLYDANSTMLIEQPEDGIHPALLAKLIDILRVNANPSQVILASHSPVVLSNLAPADIRLVDIQDGATSVRALSLPEIERAKEYMQRDGTLAEFLELIQD